jgi:hypothetical protein
MMHTADDSKTQEESRMRVERVVKIIIDKIDQETGVEGAFIAGSLAHWGPDEFTDIEIGIVSKDTLKDFRKACSLRDDLLSAIGQPAHLLEREWEHCKSISALYGKSQYPPVGMRLTLVCSQLKHVAEQMPNRFTDVIYDPDGTLLRHMADLPTTKSRDEIAQELRQHLTRYAYHLYDMLKAFSCRDRANVQSIAEHMRQAIFFTASLRSNMHGPNTGLFHLLPGEKWIVENSYQAVTRKSVNRLTELYLVCLADVQAEYGIEQEVEQFKQSLPDLL